MDQNETRNMDSVAELRKLRKYYHFKFDSLSKQLKIVTDKLDLNNQISKVFFLFKIDQF